MMRAEIVDAIDGVQAQAIDAKFFQPIQGVGDEKIADWSALRAVKVERGSPRRAIARGEVAAKLAEVISLRAKMVVNHIENHGQPASMSGIDQALQAGRSAITILRRVNVDAVVAPVARAGKLRHGHDFDGGDAQIRQFVEMLDHAVKRSFR